MVRRGQEMEGAEVKRERMKKRKEEISAVSGEAADDEAIEAEVMCR